MKVLVVIAAVIVTVILVRITEILLRFFIGNRQKLKFILRYFPILELLASLFLIFWAIDFLFSTKPYYQTIILSLIISFIALISWFVLRDLIAGVVFRTQNKIASGSSIQFGNIGGKLLHVRSTHIVIETDQGRTIKIPFSRVLNEIVSEQSEEGVYTDSVLRLKIRKNKNWKETESILKNILMNTPWRLLSHEPKINLLSEQDKYYELEIFVKTRSKKHEENLYNLLVDKFE